MTTLAPKLILWSDRSHGKIVGKYIHIVRKVKCGATYASLGKLEK